MKKTTELLSVAIANAMIIITLILSPLSLHKVGLAQAETGDREEEQTCENVEKQGEMYKIGCQFNDDLSKADVTSYYPEGVVGIVEQLIGAVFALIGVSAFYKPFPQSLKDCPTHVAAKITFPIIQAGSLSYLMGEVLANRDFRKGSEIAVNKSFKIKQDESYDRSLKDKSAREKSKQKASERTAQNDKQVQAYEALEEVYRYQVSGMKKKANLATVAEVAFITAATIETQDILSNSSVGDSTFKTLVTKDVTTRTELKKMIVTLTPIVSGGPAASACLPFVKTVSAYEANLVKSDLEKSSLGQSLALEKEATTQAQKKGVAKALGEGFLTLASKAGLWKGAGAREALAEKNHGASADKMKMQNKSLRASTIAVIDSGFVACQSALSAEAFTNLVSSTKVALAQKTLSAIPPTVKLIESQRTLPLQCRGSYSHLSPDLDSVMSPINQLGNKIDNQIQTPLKAGSLKQELMRPENLFYVEKILNNFYHQLIKGNLKHIKSQDPKRETFRYAASSQYADFLTKEAMKNLREANLEEEFYKMFPRKNQLSFIEMMSRIKLELLNSAQANNWMDLLMFGVKIGVLYYFLANTIRNISFPKPMNRAVTWTIMAAVNAAIIIFDNRAKGEAEGRLNTVRDEKLKFITSRGMKTAFADTTVKGIGGKRNLGLRETSLGNQSLVGELACAVPNGNSFAPAICDAGIIKTSFNLPLGQARFIPKNGIIGKTAELITGVASSVAGGAPLSSSSLAGSRIGQINKNKQALRRRASKLAKKIDQRAIMRDELGRPIKRTRLTSIARSFRKRFSGNAKQTGISKDQAGQINSMSLPKIENTQQQKESDSKKMTTQSKPKTPGSKMGLNPFDFEGGDEDVVVLDEVPSEKLDHEKKLEDFDLSREEINEQEHTNLFKLLSKRYLIKYSTLLKEK